MAPRKPVKPNRINENKTESKAEVKKDIKKEPKKNTGTSTGDEKGFFAAIKEFVFDERTRFVAGILMLLGVLYVAMAFISYFFTGAADQSKLDLPMSELRQMRYEIHNWTSVTGAVIAENFMHHWFGVSSFAILYFGIMTGLRLLKVKTSPLWKSFFHASFWLIWLSVTLGFALNPYVKDYLFFAPGGHHGEMVSNYIVSFVGFPGTIMILSAVLLIYSIISSKATIPFLKRVFSKKNKNEANSILNDFENEDESEPTVAVGTEIIPEDWVVKANDAEESIIIEPEDMPEEEDDDNETDIDVLPNEHENVTFEIEKPLETDDNKAVDIVDTKSEENDDPFYNVAKLGKYDPTLDLTHYAPPTLDLLKIYGTDNDTQIDMIEQNANKNRIITTLQNYGIEIDTIKATVGPTITLYEIVPKAGVRISKIRNLEYDIMLSLAATGIRIIAPIPGKGTIGIEVPNADPQVVSMHSVIASKKFQESKFELPVAFGRTITNEIFMVDLAKMPHLLVAGATGQGKSVGLNAIITSLLYKKHPSQLKLVLVDPKKVEFNIYGDIEKHFLAKLPDGEDAIITDTSKVVETLNSLCKEMDDRYDLLKKAHVRNIKEYNEKFVNRNLNPEKGHRFLPYIVVIVDEFGDLIMTAGKEVEMPIARIAQLARAVGIHMIIATQRPSVNIITGVIKANFPARVAFRVSSMIDSRTILDAPGANQLVGRGDMLFSQGSDLVRVQCAFVDTPEVENVVHHISGQQSYPTAFYLPEYIGNEGEGIDMSSVDMSKRDALFEEAARLIVANQQGSTSLIQRKFSIGYNRAGRIVDQLEVAGIIGPFEGSKARQVLVMDDYHLEQILKQL
ncbi:MAG: DNA translocase FtsK 4TM domain-containing protein [Paludibacter sp.]|jgi:S-DNA-T family DNA segregation ATPase FtsK/SpoIIIE|nr:DNA translocase FtsK 4TM domain-containing protein [Paludibacter sp.]